MWPWQHSSGSNITPGFQTPNQFPSSSYPVPHNPPAPIHSSQASIVPFHPGSYSSPEYNHTQRPQLHSPWHSEGIPTAHMSSMTNHTVPVPTSIAHKQHNPSVLDIHVDAPQPVTLANQNVQIHMAPSGGRVGDQTLSEHQNPSATYHVSSSSVSNSPFSVDFLLQKSAPTDSGNVGYGQPVHNTNQFLDQSGYAPLQTYHPSQQAPPSVSYDTSMDAGVGRGLMHGSQSMMIHASQSSHLTFPQSDDHYTDKVQAFQIPNLCSDFNSPSHPSQSQPPAPSVGSDNINIPPPEESYSPPELVLKEDEEQETRDEGTKSDDSDAKESFVSHDRVSSLQKLRPASFGIDEDDDDMQHVFPSGGFQLGVSPPMSGTCTTTDEDDKVRENQTNDNTTEHVSCDENPQLSSSDSSEMEIVVKPDAESHTSPLPLPPPLSPTPPPQEDKTDLPQLEQIPPPPPLVPTHSLPKQNTCEDEEDDDVFLPSSPDSNKHVVPVPISIKSPNLCVSTTDKIQVENDEKSCKTTVSALPLTKGERKTPTVVVGKRGRAAGKVLDEEKLRIPLSNGWQRVVRTRIVESNGPARVDICYVTPCKRRLRTFPEIQRYLDQNHITDVNIEHFSFSKKVDVGVIIDERTLMDHPEEVLAQPRRGRPPKHIRTMKAIAKDRTDMSKKEGRISLEPHEIKLPNEVGISTTPVKTYQHKSVLKSKSNQLLSILPSPEEGHTITKVANSPSSFPTSGPMTIDLPVMVPPPLIQTPIRDASNDTSIKDPSSSKRKGRKRKTQIDGPNVMSSVNKKSRGRPKGSTNKTKPSITSLTQVPEASPIPSSSRNAHKSKQNLPPPPPLNSSSLSNEIELTKEYTEIANNSTLKTNESESSLLLESLPVQSVHVKTHKHLEDKEKRRQLLLKARTTRIKKRAENLTQQRTIRKMSQQARREREKTVLKYAKEKQEKLSKQKEVEWREIRKSRLARQREDENQQKAHQRTQTMVEQLKKQEEERDRIFSLRQLEMERAEQLRKPTEDLLVKTLTSLPKFSKIEWTSLSSLAFSDLVTVFQFIRSFDEFLEIEYLPKFVELYADLFNIKFVVTEEETNGDGTMDKVREEGTLTHVLIQLVKTVIHDPGTKIQTMSGRSLREIEVKEHTVSELLRLYLIKQNDQFSKRICGFLKTHPFVCLSPPDKTQVLAFLADEIIGSSSLCREVDNRMEQISTLRRIKWKISLKLKRFRSSFSNSYGASSFMKPVLYCGRGRPPKRSQVDPTNAVMNNDGESSDDEGDGGGGDPTEAGDVDSDYSDEDSDEEPPNDRDVLQKRIKDLKKKIVLIRGRIHSASHQMRIFPIGQDRFTRQYWHLPAMGGLIVEGIDTSSFDLLNQYVADITSKLKEKEIEDRKTYDRERGESIERSSLNGNIETRESSVLDSMSSSSLQVGDNQIVSQTRGTCNSDPPSIHSDYDSESHAAYTISNTNTPTSGYTPASTPPHVSQSIHPDKPVSNMILGHPLEIQQIAQEGSHQEKIGSDSKLITSSSQHTLQRLSKSNGVTDKPLSDVGSPSLQKLLPSKKPDRDVNRNIGNVNVEPKSSMTPDVMALCPSSTLSSSASSSLTNHTSPVNTNTSNGLYQESSNITPWFSILPRKPCEMLHYIQTDSSLQQQQQQQAVMVAPQYVMPGGYTYVTPNGDPINQAVVQQVQIGYALVGNTLVPQTQYVVSPNSMAVGGNQFIALNNGQLALAGGNCSNVQYVSINGNQYAVIQPSQEQANTVDVQSQSETQDAVHSKSNTISKRTVKERKGIHKDDNVDSTTASTLAQASTKRTSTVTKNKEEPQQYVTLALPSNTGGETQYVQVQADPRVLSGECSYAVLPQNDGTMQIVIVENSSLSNGSQITGQSSDAMELECPHATVMDNEYDSSGWDVDITLMYADSPLPFLNQSTYNTNHKEKKADKPVEETLSQLLHQVDKDVTHGWWSISNSSEIDYLMRCLTMRGYREKGLYKLLHKNKESICKNLNPQRISLPTSLVEQITSMENKTDMVKPILEEDNEMEVDVIDESMKPNEDEIESTELKSSNMSPSFSNAPVTSLTKGLFLPDKDVMEYNPFLLNQHDEIAENVMMYLNGMETRLFDAHLQVKGSQKMYEDNCDNKLDKKQDSGSLLPLIADSLVRLEACVQRRYLKPPFREKSLDVKKEGSDESGKEITSAEEPLALTKWRTAVGDAKSASQLAVCMNELEKNIAWEKSPMKVFCVICRTGDNESLLLLCDNCDRGTHTYCCKPKLESIPEGDWYCHDCVINASRKSVCNVCETARGILLHCTECPKVIHKRCHNPPLTRIPIGPWQCSECRRQTRRSKPTRSRQTKDELIMCQALILELENQDNSWPFLEPVDRKKVPEYFKVIKKPMDFSTIKTKLQEGKYSSKEAFAADARLVFDNCAYYNEDESEIGMTGHAMRQFFEKKWAELT